MRVAYLLHWNDGPESGVFKKVLGQTGNWKTQGCEVKIFLLSRIDLNAFQDSDRTIESVSYKGNVVERFSRMKQLVTRLIKWNPDLVYTRFDLYYPAISTLADTIPMVVEINTDDTIEYLVKPFYVYWYNRLTRGCMLAKASGTVFVSEELSKKPYFASYSRKATVISNGIDLSGYPLMPPVFNKNPRLVFMGTPNQAWHGIEKIIRLAHQLPEWTFDLIGSGPSDLKGDIPPNIVLHGFMDRAGYEKVIARADAAIGTLALHHNQMEEGSPLKVREYLAYGIPTIVGYKDTDFPDSNQYILRLPNTPDNVRNNFEAIRKFVESLKGIRVPREFVKHIDVEYKEKARLQFMRSIAEEG